MSEKLQVQNNKVVTIQELYSNPGLSLKQDQLQEFLSQDPNPLWVKEHPNIKGHLYLPIDKVEWMLRRFFKKSQIEVKEFRQLLNSIAVMVRVHYQDPVTGEMTFQDGVGAWEMQTKSGTGVLQLDAANINRGAIPMALGIAESIAIKDACDKIGPIFGANLNRKDTMPFMPDEPLRNAEHERMVKLIEAAKNHDDLERLRPHLTEALNEIFEAKWIAVN